MDSQYQNSQRKMWRNIIFAFVLAVAMFATARSASAEYFMIMENGEVTHLKEGTFQPDKSPYQTKLDVKILDRTFVTKDAMWAANEAFFTGMSGFNDMVRAAFPMAHKPIFTWVTAQEAYWYARYVMSFGFATSHNGIHMVHGPYWTLKALEFADKSKLQRDRGERILSNKDIMMGQWLPILRKGIGIRPFDDPAPAYLIFESGMPYLTGPVPVTDTFGDPQSDKQGKWGVPEYFYNNRPFRWPQDREERYLDLGAIGQTIKRGSMWIAYMFKGTHLGHSLSPQGKKFTLHGNDAEEGFRGLILTFANANALLALKAQLVADEKGNLGGINPFNYDPSKGLRYFPHRIWPNMLMTGDMPARQWAFDINDSRSLLYDQAALLLAFTEYYHQTYRLPEIFTANPPVDGGLIEKAFGPVAHGLSNMVVKNIEAMHTRDGLFVSEWHPASTKWWLFTSYDHPGPSETMSVKDSALAILALREYVDRMRDPLGNQGNLENPDIEPVLTKKAMGLVTRNADFLMTVQNSDGSFCEGYNVVNRSCLGGSDVSFPQFMAIRGLLAAYHATGDLKYTEAARNTWNYVNAYFWHEPTGLFRTRRGDDTIIITTEDLAAQIGAYREIMFTTPIHLVEPLIDRWPRWWIQTVNMTGLIQGEENRTGELCHGVCSADFDNDGIPWFGKSHAQTKTFVRKVIEEVNVIGLLGTKSSKFGVAPVFARAVAVNVGGPGNAAFAALNGEPHDPERWGGTLVYGYQPKPLDQALNGIVLPLTLDIPRDEDGDPIAQYDDDGNIISGWVDRRPMLRFDGMTYPLPPAQPFTRGSQFTGRQIFEMNCAHCHGYSGEGITGIPFIEDSLRRTRDDMFEVPKNGRFSRLMPEWGLGNRDEMGTVLTDEEIYRIVDYVQSKEFQRMVKHDFVGIVNPGVPPKDAYFFATRAYLNGRKSPLLEGDLQAIMAAQLAAYESGKPLDMVTILNERDYGQEVVMGRNVAQGSGVFGVLASFFSRSAIDEVEEQGVDTPAPSSQPWFNTLSYYQHPGPMGVVGFLSSQQTKEEQ